MNKLTQTNNIQDRILTIREEQVILDRDLAILYQTETRILKQSVKRNSKKFPSDFMFELTNKDIELLVSQSVIPSKSYFGGATPFAFTEQGVAMLSSVIKTNIAIEVSITIIRAFVEMRKFIYKNANIFNRLDNIEKKHIVYQFETNEKFNRLFNALETKELQPKQGIFYNGQIFDAYTLIADIIRSAKKSIILIDNYIDDTVFKQLAKRKTNVDAIIYAKKIDAIVKQDLQKYNSQYSKIEIKKITTTHDRFLIIDKKTVYHFGASLKDAGKKWFAFSKLNIDANDILDKL